MFHTFYSYILKYFDKNKKKNIEVGTIFLSCEPTIIWLIEISFGKQRYTQGFPTVCSIGNPDLHIRMFSFHPMEKLEWYQFCHAPLNSRTEGQKTTLAALVSFTKSLNTYLALLKFFWRIFMYFCQDLWAIYARKKM